MEEQNPEESVSQPQYGVQQQKSLWGAWLDMIWGPKKK
jgi:hypothetical protein